MPINGEAISLNESNHQPEPSETEISPACADPSRAQCPVCLRSMPVTRVGVICVHGMVGNRCPGSQQPPSPFSQSQRTPAQDFLPREKGVLFRKPLVKILKRIPRASRDLSAKKLASILDQVTEDNSTASWERSSNLRPVTFEYQSEGGTAEAWPPM